MQTTKPSVKFNCPKVKGTGSHLLSSNGQVLYQADYRMASSWNFLEKTLKGRSYETIGTIKAKNRNSSGDLSIQDDQEPNGLSNSTPTDGRTQTISTPCNSPISRSKANASNMVLRAIPCQRSDEGQGILRTWQAGRNARILAPNGQLASSGNYENGIQNGKWVWWHENGMRKAMATYSKGRDQNVMAGTNKGNESTTSRRHPTLESMRRESILSVLQPRPRPFGRISACKRRGFHDMCEAAFSCYEYLCRYAM